MPPVRTERKGKVLEITLDVPPVNAIDLTVSTALHAGFRELQEDDDLAVGIVMGAGQKVFSAGWNLKSVAAATSMDQAVAGAAPGGFAGIAENWELHKPLVAAVNGHAIGGGFELALGCDLIVAAEGAEFWLPEMQLGFLPDAGAIQRLPRRIPYNVAMGLLLTGRHMSAAEGKQWGLVHDVVPRDQVIGVAREIAAKISEGAPLALQALKAVMLEIMTLPIPEAMARMKLGKSRIAAYEKMMKSEDSIEGPRAFVEKRKPYWKGR